MSPRRIAAALAFAVPLAAAGGAVAVAGEGTTTITVDPAKRLSAGDRAPFDAPGVASIRQGAAIPAGYELIGRTVRVERGRETAGASLRFRCPGTKRLRTFGTTGTVGFGITQSYVGKRSTIAVSFPPPKERVSGTVYAVCR